VPLPASRVCAGGEGVLGGVAKSARMVAADEEVEVGEGDEAGGEDDVRRTVVGATAGEDEKGGGWGSRRGEAPPMAEDVTRLESISDGMGAC